MELTREQKIEVAEAMASEVEMMLDDNAWRTAVRYSCDTLSEAKYALRRLRWTIVDQKTGENLLG